MNRKLKWLLGLSQRADNPGCSPRRIVAPERLEHRIAPGVMLPLFGHLFDGATESADETGSITYHEREIRPLHRPEEVVAPANYGPITRDIDLEQIQLKDELHESVPSTAVEGPRIPYEVAALDAAFESLADGFESILNELSPRLIQPVIMDPASPHNQEGAPAIPAAEATLPVLAPVVLPVDLGPPIVQPVIMDPESEHNAPNSTESLLAAPAAAAV